MEMFPDGFLLNVSCDDVLSIFFLCAFTSASPVDGIDYLPWAVGVDYGEKSASI